MEKRNFTFFQYVWIFIAGCYGGFLVEPCGALSKTAILKAASRSCWGRRSASAPLRGIIVVCR